MGKPTVFVTRRWPQSVEAKLKTHFNVVLNAEDKALAPSTLKMALAQSDALLPTVTDRICASVLDVVKPRTQIIANYGVGFNHVDIDAARRHGMIVTNTPDVLSQCTADLAMTLMLMVARRAGEGERELRSGTWDGWRPTHLMGQKISGKILGVVGFGRIGRETAHRAHFGFGMKICVYNRSKVDPSVLARFNATQVDDLDDLLTQSDVVSLHCPGGQSNRHLINAERLSKMKSSAYLINTARGEVVDEDALAQALWFETIAGAGLDVFDGEPTIRPALMNCENAVLLPHLGSATRETREAMGFRVIDNLVAFFDGCEPADRVA